MSDTSATPRFGITSVSVALNKRGIVETPDPYGVEIGYYDKDTKIRGTVKLMHHQVPSDLWTPINEGLNSIVEHALRMLQP